MAFTNDDELIKVTFDKFDFENPHGIILFSSAKGQTSERYVKDFKRKSRLVLWYTEETVLNLSEMIKMNGGTIHP